VVVGGRSGRSLVTLSRKKLNRGIVTLKLTLERDEDGGRPGEQQKEWRWGGL